MHKLVLGYSGSLSINGIDTIIGGCPKYALLIDCQGIDSAFRDTTRQERCCQALSVLPFLNHHQTLFPCSNPCAAPTIGKTIHSHTIGTEVGGRYNSMGSRIIKIEVATLGIHHHLTIRPLLHVRDIIGFHARMSWIGRYMSCFRQSRFGKAHNTGILLPYPDITIAITMDIGQIVGSDDGIPIVGRVVLHPIGLRVIDKKSLSICCNVVFSFGSHDG